MCNQINIKKKKNQFPPLKVKGVDFHSHGTRTIRKKTIIHIRISEFNKTNQIFENKTNSSKNNEKKHLPQLFDFGL